MDPRRNTEPKVKVATRSEAVSGELVLFIGLVVVLLIGVASGL